MAFRYSTVAVGQRVLATVESATATTLTRTTRSPPSRLISSQGGRLSIRTSSSFTSKLIRLYNVRHLDVPERQYHAPHLKFDLAREGSDFHIWRIGVKGGLSRSEYESMREILETELSTQADVFSLLETNLLKQRDHFGGRCPYLTTRPFAEPQEPRVRVFAHCDVDLDEDVPTDCKFFFSLPADVDPTVSFLMISREDK